MLIKKPTQTLSF